ncbi:MAG: hypothetical protein H6728_10620 [Myxococcales bacterium]|nr:hypothetical protein [Myxococcales bacterium]MCB9643512.1 hypothetical protein [Myxococcales bacterium]
MRGLRWLLFVATLCISFSLGQIDKDLRGPDSPRGIVSFEFCGYTATCDKMIKAWGSVGRESAMLSLGLDYLFLVIYPLCMCFCLLWVADRLPTSLSRYVRGIAYLALVSGVADAIENYGLIQVLRGNQAMNFAWWAGTFAVIKFSIVVLALLTFVFAFLISKMKPVEEH